ncbi:MAG: acyl-CoA-binding protein [Hymenobacteraceae bacterium]|nr:acyl-CoA-binding protein [Hymenobacteraceae bacterium]
MHSANSSSDLNQQFQQAADRVSNLPPEQAGAGMNTLYGLYKQATDGDHDTFQGEVGREDHDNPDGPAGLSQAQWDSWSQFKGLSQDDAKRRYVQEAGKISGDGAAGAHGKGDGPAPQKTKREPEGAAASTDPTPTGTEAAAANAGLRGDLRAGATYGSEEERKEDADAQRGSGAQPGSTITES